MAVFSPLLDVLANVPDPRRAQGQLYKLPHVLLFAILAIVTGCNSYRGVVTFIAVHRRKLNAAFSLNWKRAPAHIDIAEKSNEIPAAQALLAELGVADGAIVTLDALHCQKNISKSQQPPTSP